MRSAVCFLLAFLAAVNALSSPRMVAYINCLCGFGWAGTGADTCLDDPPPSVNFMQNWESAGDCPITHYVLAFLSFSGSKIQSDPGSIWANSGSSTNFTLSPTLLTALKTAEKNGKKVILSMGGESGSSAFLQYWNSKGSSTSDKVSGMRKDIQNLIDLFNSQNGLNCSGIDVDIELGGGYAVNSDKYASTRDLINAVPDGYTVAFVPQVGNGLCVPPAVGDPLTPSDTLGGQCMEPPANGSSWSLAQLDTDCKTSSGTRKLDYFGIQYYNAGEAICCGGGASTADQITSTWQHYKNLANGWAEVTASEMADPSNPWHQWEWYPGPWDAFQGVDADRLVMGKPGCKGCAGSDYLALNDMISTVNALNHKLNTTMGGVLWWDLCRLFGNTGGFCVGGQCQPSWGGTDIQANLNKLYKAMTSLTPA